MTITEHLESIIPHGPKCYGCPKSDPQGIQGYSGDVFCHLLEEVVADGDKQCGFNESEIVKHDCLSNSSVVECDGSRDKCKCWVCGKEWEEACNFDDDYG